MVHSWHLLYLTWVLVNNAQRKKPITNAYTIDRSSNILVSLRRGNCGCFTLYRRPRRGFYSQISVGRIVDVFCINRIKQDHFLQLMRSAAFIVSFKFETISCDWGSNDLDDGSLTWYLTKVPREIDMIINGVWYKNGEMPALGSRCTRLGKVDTTCGHLDRAQTRRQSSENGWANKEDFPASGKTRGRVWRKS
jgi:hypothetical protein